VLLLDNRVELLKTCEKDEEAVMHACGALLSLCTSQHLRASLTKVSCLVAMHPLWLC